MKIKKFKHFTLLIAEDDVVNYIYLTEALKNQKVDIIHAKNGREAVELCKKKSVDLVLMDIRMPEMNGYEATKLIKTNSPELPVIAVTAFSMTETREKAIEAGCDNYFTKPISKNQLLEIIQEYN